MNRLTKLAIISSLCLLPAVSGLAYTSTGQKAVYEKNDGTNVGARVTFSYKDDSLFKVNTKPGFVTDVQLREGETLAYVAGGDTTAWMIDKAMVGNVQHVYIKPMEPDKHTNVIINTDMHTYRLDVWSTMDGYDPLITFRFPNDRKEAIASSTYRPPYGKMNKDYEIKAKKQSKFAELIPKTVMDDGVHTYIKVPSTNRYDMPVLYMVNPWDKKKTLINYRVRDGYFVADTVMAHGKLLFHQKYGIDFYNRKKMAEYDASAHSMRERVEEIQAERNQELDIGQPSTHAWAPPEAMYDIPEPVKQRPPRRARETVAPPEFPAGQAERELQRRPMRPVAPPPSPQVMQQPVVQQQPMVQQQPVMQQQPPRRVVSDNGYYPGAGNVAEEVARQAGLGNYRSSASDTVAAPVKKVSQPAVQLVDVQLDDGRVARISANEFNSLPEQTRAALISQNRVALVKA